MNFLNYGFRTSCELRKIYSGRPNELAAGPVINPLVMDLRGVNLESSKIKCQKFMLDSPISHRPDFEFG